ncbi:MAG TPA: ADOP family duplicated permease [Gemmatimonadaceae bacterium]|jgi:predicted permease
MRFLRRVARWLRSRAHEADLRDELAFHHEMVERDLIARGLSTKEARVAARRVMGNETFMREEARSVWVWSWLDVLRQDAAYTIRSLEASPGFTIAVVLTLALGLGANAAMFSFVDRLLFRPPPLLVDPASTHRVYLYRTNDGVESERSGIYARHTDLVRWSTSFSHFAAFEQRLIAVGTGDATREMPIGIVTAGFFDFFDARPRLGRYFTPAEDSPPAGAPVAVVSDAFWRTQYGARADVLGSTIAIGPVVYTIIGVGPPGFVGLWPERAPAFFIPVCSFGASRGAPDWWNSYGHAIGIEAIVRRKPGVSVAAATADLTTALRRSYQADLDSRPNRGGVTVDQLRPRAVVASILAERGPEASSVGRVAFWLSGVALIVLLVACANVANLLLARAVRRRREIAVRVALGISRRRLVAQPLIESMLLALAGGGAGLLLSQWASRMLHAAFLPGDSQPPVIGDPRTALAVAAMTLIVGLLAGIVPALQVGRGDVIADLKAGAREGTYQRSRLRTGLLLAQSTLCVVLLSGAGLFVRSLRNVREVRLGYDVDPVLVVDLNMRGVRLDRADLTTLNQRLLEAVTTMPGVERASLMKTVPFGGISSLPLFVAGIDSVDKFGEFDQNAVSPEYFATMGTRILRGRSIEATDIAGKRPVMVVDASMAAALWPGQDALGRCVRVGADTAPCTYVVGVAEDIHSRSLSDDAGHFLYYFPIAQTTPDDAGLFVRARGAARLVEPVRRRLQREMPGASYVSVSPFADILGEQTRSWTLGATAFTAFGALALIVAALGLYSVIAYSVTQRTHELGVRMALGARAMDVVSLVVGEGVRFGVAGLVLGGIVTVAAAPWIGPLLFRESPRDPVVLGGVSAVLIVVTIAASWIPALRAARLDPRRALLQAA